MNRIRLTNSTWWKIIGLIFFGIVTINSLSEVIGHAEGSLFPVYRNVTISSIDEFNYGEYIEFSGTFEKIRDCELVQYEWFLTSPTGEIMERFDVFIFNARWRDHRVGSNEFGPRRTYLDVDLFLNYAYGIAVHECHPLWNTRTIFFKGTEVK